MSAPQHQTGQQWLPWQNQEGYWKNSSRTGRRGQKPASEVRLRPRGNAITSGMHPSTHSDGSETSAFRDPKDLVLYDPKKATSKRAPSRKVTPPPSPPSSHNITMIPGKPREMVG